MLRKLLVAAFAVGVTLTVTATLWTVTGDRTSAQVERKNCPADFHWERMSGQCCVQDYETIPDHGRIGYTGNSICDDGYVAIFEHRPTTDGRGVDGCPGFTSFVFLKSCVSSSAGAAAAGGGALGGGGAIRNLSKALYDDGSGPSPEDLATVGGASAGVLILTGGTILVLRQRAMSAKQLSDWALTRGMDRQALVRDVEQARREEQAALEELDKVREKQWQLKKEKWDLEDALRKWADYLQQLEGQSGRLGTLGTLTGIMSIIFSLLGGEPILVAGSVTMSVTGIGTGVQGGSVQQLKDNAVAMIAKIEDRMRVADENIRKYDRVVQIATDRVKDTRGRADAAEDEYRGYSKSDFWPRRERPVLKGEYTWDDWNAGRRPR